MSDLPPSRPPDLRDPRNRRTDDEQNQQGQTPPQGQWAQPQQYPPQQYPPPPAQGDSRPVPPLSGQTPPGGYPPQQQYPPQQYPPPLPDDSRPVPPQGWGGQQGQWNQQQPPPGGQWGQQQQPPPQGGQWNQPAPPPQGWQGQPPAQGGQWNQPAPPLGPNLPGTGSLNPNRVPPLGAQSSGNRPSGSWGQTGSLSPQAAPRLSANNQPMGFVSERQIEYIAWGSSILLLGIAIIIMALNPEGTGQYVLPGIGLLAGSILMAGGLVQRIVFGYHVSRNTWIVAIVLTALSLTRVIALASEQGDDFGVQSIFFFGLMVVMAGLVIMLQVFSPQRH